MLSLRQKLVLSYLLLIAIMVGVGAYGIHGTRRIGRAIDDIVATDSNQAIHHGQTVARRLARREEIALLVAVGAGALLGLYFAAQFTYLVVHPITRLARSAKEIAGGNLDQQIAVRSQDEVGQMAREFNRMAVRLREFRESAAGRVMLEQGLSDAVLQSIFEPVIVADSKGEVLKLNRAAIELLGTAGESPATLASTPGGEKILRAVRDAVGMQQPVAQEGEAAILPLKIRNDERSYRMRTTPIRDSDGKLLGAVTVLEDLTELRGVDRFKTQFLSVASQKLRQPLEAIRLGLYTLRRGLAGDLRPLQSEIVEDAHQQAEGLDDLMADLIELAEVDTGARALEKARLRPVDILRNASERFSADARSKGVTLEYFAYPDISYVVADRRAARSIFDNLLTNALRFTPNGGSVTLQAQEKKDAVQFFVRDTGRGIEPERLAGIFGRFSSSGGGTGLGLALVRRLVESMGGQISVESRVSIGTVFSFTLPTAAAELSRHPVEIG
jgi:two-component system, NtrC family, sensor histidine kinase KinB